MKRRKNRNRLRVAAQQRLKPRKKMKLERNWQSLSNLSKEPVKRLLRRTAQIRISMRSLLSFITRPKKKRAR